MSLLISAAACWRGLLMCYVKKCSPSTGTERIFGRASSKWGNSRCVHQDVNWEATKTNKFYIKCYATVSHKLRHSRSTRTTPHGKQLCRIRVQGQLLAVLHGSSSTYLLALYEHHHLYLLIGFYLGSTENLPTASYIASKATAIEPGAQQTPLPFHNLRFLNISTRLSRLLSAHISHHSITMASDPKALIAAKFLDSFLREIVLDTAIHTHAKIKRARSICKLCGIRCQAHTPQLNSPMSLLHPFCSAKALHRALARVLRCQVPRQVQGREQTGLLLEQPTLRMFGLLSTGQLQPLRYPSCKMHGYGL